MQCGRSIFFVKTKKQHLAMPVSLAFRAVYMNNSVLQGIDFFEDGGPDEDRTRHPLLAKQVLCRMSYRPTAHKII